MQRTLDDIDDLLDDDRYAWAFTLLCGIRETISTSGIVTDRQHAAITNVRNAVSSQQRQAALGERLPSERYGSRRYEGHVPDPSSKR